MLFELLEMDHSYGDHGQLIKSHEAEFYELIDNNYRRWHTFGFPRSDINLSYKWAGGGLVSTPSDLVKMGNALVTDTSFIDFHIRDQFFTPQKLNNGQVNEQKYALGWRSYKDYYSEHLTRNEKEKVWIVHHGGVSKGSMNLLCLFPDQGLVIDVTVNGRENEIDFAPFWNHVMNIASPFLLKTMEEEQNRN